MMIITLDNLSTRYKMVPTELLANATTFDLYVADVASKWERRQRDIAEGVIDPKAEKLTQQQMLDMIKNARGQ